MKLKRRDFLRQLAVGAGAGALGALSGPFGLGGGRARAASGLAGPAGGAIFLVLNGGARTQAVFNGTVGSGANPFGQLTGLMVPLSAVMDGTQLADPATNARLNLVATAQHHNRTGDHDTGRVVACTGFTPREDKPGILTILNQAFAFRDVPCVNIGDDTPTTFIGSEISSTFAPIKISSARDVEEITNSVTDTAVSPRELARIDALRYALQDRFLRSTVYDEPADIPFFQRRAIEVAERFEGDALRVDRDASLGRYLDGSPVSNGGLRAAFGTDRLGESAMLALRLRQLGCGGVTISTGNWDMHSNEERNLPGRAAEVGRILGAFIDQMSRIEAPLSDGASLLDTTVITVLTDFGRGNWSNGSGFNGTQGSDHRSNEDKTCLQCIPLIGGGLPGGRMLGEIGNDGSAVGSSPVFTTRQILATVLDLLGIPPTLFLPGDAPALTEELSG